MRRRAVAAFSATYAVAWTYLVAFVVAQLVYAALPAHDQVALVGWASTSVHNLRHHPVGSLVVSALIPQESVGAWPVLIALSMFGANRALGNWRTALVCGAGHVIGTLVSEGIVAYQVDHGLLPAADRYLIDVGPSYVVVSAIVVALLLGSWPARAAAAIDLVILVGPGDIFGGLSSLAVSAVGHFTALVVAVIGTGILAWQARRARSALADRLAGDRLARVVAHGPASPPGSPAAPGGVAAGAECSHEEPDRPVRPQRQRDRRPHGHQSDDH